MALPSINILVKHSLPYLVNNEETDALIAAQLLALFYLMQEQTHKTDEQVETEAEYTPLERLFFAEYVAYELYVLQVAQGTAGKAGALPEPTKTVKRAKADVVEVEFEILKMGNQSPLDMLARLRESVCAKARMLKFSIPLCYAASPGAFYPGGFVFRPGNAGSNSPGAADY